MEEKHTKIAPSLTLTGFPPFSARESKVINSLLKMSSKFRTSSLRPCTRAGNKSSPLKTALEIFRKRSKGSSMNSMKIKMLNIWTEETQRNSFKSWRSKKEDFLSRQASCCNHTKFHLKRKWKRWMKLKMNCTWNMETRRLKSKGNFLKNKRLKWKSR